ncbi:hypothetical protein HZS_5942 [Henneguya salminicola]|uniref:Serine/arginine-rich splicing factor 2 n=1 Tax=Henneguya salminicola TaxID=69463 RepID=A0A6G3MEE4_HENSL|nr:hypothetical protein HZS_5942 [Henneguya salminicola]
MSEERYTVFVGNVPFKFMDEDLRKIFEKIGNVRRVKILRDYSTNRSKGFGYVSFESQSEVDDAIEQMNGHEVGERRLNVQVAREREPRNDDSRPRRDNYRRDDRREDYRGGRDRSYGDSSRDSRRERSSYGERDRPRAHYRDER